MASGSAIPCAQSLRKYDERIIPTRGVNLSDFDTEEHNISEYFKAAGWIPYLEKASFPWHEQSVLEFWNNSEVFLEETSGLKTSVMGMPIRVNFKVLKEIIGVEATREQFSSDWEINDKEEEMHDQLLFGHKILETPVCSQLLEIPRILLEIINCCILPKRKDAVIISGMERFVLIHLLQGKRLNLPRIILYHMMRRKLEEIKDFPHTTLIMKILQYKGFSIERFFDQEPSPSLTLKGYRHIKGISAEKNEVQSSLSSTLSQIESSDSLSAHGSLREIFRRNNIKRLDERIGRLEGTLRFYQKELQMLKAKREKVNVNENESVNDQ